MTSKTRILWATLVAMFLITASARAQVDVTASGGVAAASYTTLKGAFDAINAGTHTGVIGIALTGNTTETATATLLGSGGASSYTSIGISPSGGALRTIAGNIAGALISFDGADNVTVDGFNAGGDALTIENTNTAGGAGGTTGTSTIRFLNNATFNTIRNCTINGSAGNTPTSTTGTIFFGSTTVAPGNDSNTITTCNVGATIAGTPRFAVYSSGNTGATLTNSSITISNNNIYDFFNGVGSAGIQLQAGSSDWTITGNSFYQTASRAVTGTGTTFGVNIVDAASTGTNHDVSGNFIGGSAPLAAGSAWTVTGAFSHGFTAIFLGMSSSGTPIGTVQNNTITNLVWNTNGNWLGIRAQRGNVTISGNTIGSGVGTGAISRQTGTDSPSAFAGISTANPGTASITGNTIGSVNVLSTSAGLIAGLTVITSTAGTPTISNNLIGSLTTPFSISAPANTGDSQDVTGISVSSSGMSTISGNTLANLRNAYSQTENSRVRGIVATNGSNTISLNTLRDFTSGAGGSGTGTSAVLQGIAVTATSGTQLIDRNTIHTLQNTRASGGMQAVGIHYSGPSTGTQRIVGNIIHSLSLVTTSTSATIVGINVAGGQSTFANNMVRLGIRPDGTSIPAAYAITGIAKAGTGANNFYFNSVFIGGTGVGSTTTNTYAFRRTATGVDDIRNNVLANRRANATTGGRHFAYVLNAATTVTSDRNLYDVPGGSTNIFSLDGGTTAIGNLQAWRAALAAQELGSGIGSPNFVSPTGNAATMSLKVQSPTAVEGAGVAIGSVTDDQEGQLRLSPPDIGADEGAYAMDASTDAYTPQISYTPLLDTSSLADRALSVTITDIGQAAGGVPTTGPTTPRIWYKKSTSGTWTLSQPGVLQAGDGFNGTWSFPIVAADFSPPLAGGETIQYYVVAEDQAATPNVWYNPFAATNPIHSNVNTQTTPPATPNTYTIIPTITASAGANGSIAPPGVTVVPIGNNQSYTMTPNAGYHVDDVLVDAVSVGAVTTYDFLNVTTNHTIHATFAISAHNITAAAGPGGSIAPAGVTAVPNGGNQSYTITPNAGFFVLDVLVDAVSVGAVTSYDFINVTAPHTISASFSADNVISAVNPVTCVSTANPCATVPVNITRSESTPLRGFSVTFTLSPELMLCAGVVSVTEGAYLSSVGATTFLVTDNGGGSYTADGVILGTPCGVTASAGNLLNIGVKNSGADGTGTVAVTSVTLRDCDNVNVAVAAGGSATVTIDNTLPTAITDLAATQVTAGNDADGTTQIMLSFTTPGDASGVEVYRAPFGSYPEYDDAAGAVPSIPAYPPGAPWALTPVTAGGQPDEVTTRDFWYYVVFAKDACGNASLVSNMTGGTLNYHLGDVSDGVTPGQGDNLVNGVDLSLLGANYGATGAAVTPVNYLDVGPTATLAPSGRPLTDNRLDFEDLVMFALNFGLVSAPQTSLEPVSPATTNALVLEAPGHATAGGIVTARLVFSGTGSIHALSTKLSWDPAVVRPEAVEAGDIVSRQNGILLSSASGIVDVAMLGSRRRGLTGEGELAIVRFAVLKEGDPGIAVATTDARDASNQAVKLEALDARPEALPARTSLDEATPNPFRGVCALAFSLSVPGRVELAIYSVDGRRVRAMLRGAYAAGRHQVAWDGRDDLGRKVAAGVFYARMTTADGQFSRRLTLLP